MEGLAWSGNLLTGTAWLANAIISKSVILGATARLTRKTMWRWMTCSWFLCGGWPGSLWSNTATPPSQMFGHSVFVCGRFLTLPGFALIKTCRIQNCSPLSRQGRAQSYQPPETATETSMIWCRSAGISMRVWDQPSEKSTFFCSERIWDILQSSCINIPPDKGIELILTRFTKKIGNSRTFSGKTWQN